jgi:hypothetical protein
LVISASTVLSVTPLDGVLALNPDVPIVIVVSPDVDTILLLARSPVAVKVRRIPTELYRSKHNVLELIPRFGSRNV